MGGGWSGFRGRLRGCEVVGIWWKDLSWFFRYWGYIGSFDVMVMAVRSGFFGWGFRGWFVI